MSSPPGPTKFSITEPTALERFFVPSTFTELFPSIRPHLINGDLKRLAQVPGIINRVATITIYQESDLQVDHATPSTKTLMYGMNDQAPVGRISKMEALSFVKHIDLFKSTSKQATALLKLSFPRLQSVTIWVRYLHEILDQYQVETAFITSGLPDTDVPDPDLPFDFPEARLVTHLASYATRIEILVPHKVWWNVPDLGDRLLLNNIEPIDTLVLWIYSASSVFHRFPAKNLVVKLGTTVLRDRYGHLHSAAKVPGLAVIKHILDSRAVISSNVTIQVHRAPYMSVLNEIFALHPHMLANPSEIPPWFHSCEWMVEEQLFKHTTVAGLSKMVEEVYMADLETVKNTLCERHAKTDVEKADFEQIKFSYLEMGSGESCIMVGFNGLRR